MSLTKSIYYVGVGSIVVAIYWRHIGFRLRLECKRAREIPTRNCCHTICIWACIVHDFVCIEKYFPYCDVIANKCMYALTRKMTAMIVHSPYSVF